MCNIVMLGEGVSIPYPKFENMVHNNPHGFGLILKDKKNKKLQVIRRCPPAGNDPKEIYDLLEDNKDIERYLHVRWRTDGPIDIDNTHPFPAYISDTRQVYFMHNGVLNDYKPSQGRVTWMNGVKTQEEEAENTSDSKKFNDEFLAPYLLTSSGANGKADINDPIFHKIIHKFWGNGDSKGLLICNDLESVQINTSKWHELDLGGGKFWSSNNTYFDNLIRGPVYEEKKKKREEEEARQRASKFQSGVSVNRSNKGIITDLKDLDLKAREIKSEELFNIFEDYNIWDEEGMAALNNITPLQFEELVKKSPEEAVNLLLTLTGYYSELFKRYKRLTEWIEGQGKTKPKDM